MAENKIEVSQERINALLQRTEFGPHEEDLAIAIGLCRQMIASRTALPVVRRQVVAAPGPRDESDFVDLDVVLGQRAALLRVYPGHNPDEVRHMLGHAMQSIFDNFMALRVKH